MPRQIVVDSKANEEDTGLPDWWRMGSGKRAEFWEQRTACDKLSVPKTKTVPHVQAVPQMAGPSQNGRAAHRHLHARLVELQQSKECCKNPGNGSADAILSVPEQRRALVGQHPQAF